MPDPVEIKIKSSADNSGVKSADSALDNLRRGAEKAGNEWEHLGTRIAKKFSGADITKEVLSGLGIGSGFAVAERLAGLFEQHLEKAAESWKSIAEYSERQLIAVEKSLSLRRTDVQNLAELRDRQESDRRKLDALQAPRTYERVIPVDHGLSRTETATRPETEEETAKRQKLDTEIKERKVTIDELAKSIKAAADAERAQISADEKLAQSIKEVNKLVGEGGLERAEADKRIAQLTKERNDELAKQADDRIRLQVDESTKIQDAQKRISDALKESAQKYREISDPQEKYKAQVKEIDYLTRAFAANGKPFLTLQEGAAAKARLLAELNDDAGKAIRATREEVEKYDIALEVLDKNPALSDAEKQERRIELINKQTEAIRRAKEALTEFMKAHPGVDVGALTEALNRFGQQAARNAGLLEPAQTLQQRDDIALRDRSDPAKHYQTQGAGAAGGAQGFLASLGTAADTTAAAIEGTLNGALENTSNFLYDIFTRANSFKEAWNRAIVSVGQNFAKMAADMVAKLLWRATIERALIALGVITHAQGEGAKTAATTAGVGARLLLIVKEALAAVYHGAVSAFSAMASIPYVGPILGAAAMAAALALGIGLVSKIGHKEGGYTATGPADKPAGIVHAGEWVAPQWMVKDKRYRPMISMLEGMRTGRGGYAIGGFVDDLPALNPASISGLGADLASVANGIANQLSPAAAAAPAHGGGSAGDSQRPLNIAILDHRDSDAYERFIRDPRAESYIMGVMQRNRRMLGIRV